MIKALVEVEHIQQHSQDPSQIPSSQFQTIQIQHVPK